jgi:hypothetical protein
MGDERSREQPEKREPEGLEQASDDAVEALEKGKDGEGHAGAGDIG